MSRAVAHTVSTAIESMTPLLEKGVYSATENFSHNDALRALEGYESKAVDRTVGETSEKYIYAGGFYLPRDNGESTDGITAFKVILEKYKTELNQDPLKNHPVTLAFCVNDPKRGHNTVVEVHFSADRKTISITNLDSLLPEAAPTGCTDLTAVELAVVEIYRAGWFQNWSGASEIKKATHQKMTLADKKDVQQTDSVNCIPYVAANIAQYYESAAATDQANAAKANAAKATVAALTGAEDSARRLWLLQKMAEAAYRDKEAELRQKSSTSTGAEIQAELTENAVVTATKLKIATDEDVKKAASSGVVVGDIIYPPVLNKQIVLSQSHPYFDDDATSVENKKNILKVFGSNDAYKAKLQTGYTRTMSGGASSCDSFKLEKAEMASDKQCHFDFAMTRANIAADGTKTAEPEKKLTVTREQVPLKKYAPNASDPNAMVTEWVTRGEVDWSTRMFAVATCAFELNQRCAEAMTKKSQDPNAIQVGELKDERMKDKGGLSVITITEKEKLLIQAFLKAGFEKVHYGHTGTGQNRKSEEWTQDRLDHLEQRGSQTIATQSVPISSVVSSGGSSQNSIPPTSNSSGAPTPRKTS